MIKAFWTWLGMWIRRELKVESKAFTSGGPWDGPVPAWMDDMIWSNQGSASVLKFIQATQEAHSKFKYISDPEGDDHWYLPDEFEARGGGDCEDWATWIIERANHLGVDISSMAWVYILRLSDLSGHIAALLFDEYEDPLVADNNQVYPRRWHDFVSEFPEYKPVAFFGPGFKRVIE